MVRISLTAAAVVAMTVLVLAPEQSEAAPKKEPPSCAAISFKPFSGPLTTTPVQSGHYKSRFGSIDLMGALENGQPNYRVTVNNKPLQKLSGDIPKSTYACLNSKHIKTPPPSAGATCDGTRFRVAIDSTGKQKLVMLFALHGDTWTLCEAGTPQG